MRTRRAIYAAAALALLLLPGPTAGQQQTVRESPKAFEVVVHASNPVGTISRESLRRIFLRTERLWADGQPIRPVDQSMTSPVRAAFSASVLQMSILALRHHWSQHLFAGGEPPPPTRDSDQSVLAFVGQSRGAVGYVTPGTALPVDARDVEVTR